MQKATLHTGFNNYQNQAKEYAIYPYAYFNDLINGGHVVARQLKAVYPALGLCGEAGEVSEKIKKIIRDKNGKYTEEDAVEISKELGDVLWYVSELASCFGLKLEDIANENINKLKSRKDRDVLSGSGDNR